MIGISPFQRAGKAFSWASWRNLAVTLLLRRAWSVANDVLGWCRLGLATGGHGGSCHGPLPERDLCAHWPLPGVLRYDLHRLLQRRHLLHRGHRELLQLQPAVTEGHDQLHRHGDCQPQLPGEKQGLSCRFRQNQWVIQMQSIYVFSLIYQVFPSTNSLVS